MSEYRIVKTVELSGMPSPALAKDLLERLRLATAKVVENRKWRVPVLKEFYPKNRSLLGLNVNRGKSIMIRLREGHDQMSFLPWESVLGTLVHELTHNEIGEHSAAFYSMMEKVYDEVDATSSSGGSLWGPAVPSTPKYQFDGKSSKVGGGSLAKNSGIAKDDVRQLAAEAALRRMGQQSSAGGQRVGGMQAVSTKTRKELFLEAEERRRQLEVDGQFGCSLTSSQQEQPSAQKGSHDGIVYTSSGSNTVSGSLSEFRWVCQVCTEENVTQGPLPAQSLAGASSSAGSSSSKKIAVGELNGVGSDVVCGWCGCSYGSSLMQGGGKDGDNRSNAGANKQKQAATLQGQLSAGGRYPSSKNTNTSSRSGGGGVPEIFCIDCDSPEGINFSGQEPKKTKSIVNLIADDATNGSSRSATAGVTQRDRSGSLVDAEGEEVCRWTQLEARGCPCCIVLVSPDRFSEAASAGSGSVGRGHSGDGKAENDIPSVNADTTIKTEGKEDDSNGDKDHKIDSKTSQATSLSRSKARTTLSENGLTQTLSVKRKKVEVDPADVIVID